MPTPEADVPVPPPPRQQGWETTTPTQEQAVRLQITPLLGLVTLADVNAADVRYLKQTLLDRGLAPDTVAYVQGVLSTALNQAVSDRLIPENPSRLVKRARSRTQKMRTLDQEQAQKLIASVEGTPHRTFYLVAVRLGLRRGELLGLRWPDFDASRRELSVRRAVIVRGGEERWTLPKDGEERTIRLGPTLVVALQERRKMQTRLTGWTRYFSNYSTEGRSHEGLRQLMDITSNTLITVVVTFVVSGPLAYFIGLAQSRRQRLEDRRAEVIAELVRHLYIVQNAFYKWSHLEEEGATSRQVVADRYAKRGAAAFETLNDLILYYYSNKPWLYQSTSAKNVEEFIKMAKNIANSHPPDLQDIDFLKTEEGQKASIRMSVAMPQLMSRLIEEFGEIINPPPWYLHALELLEARGRKDDAQR